MEQQDNTADNGSENDRKLPKNNPNASSRSNNTIIASLFWLIIAYIVLSFIDASLWVVSYLGDPKLNIIYVIQKSFYLNFLSFGIVILLSYILNRFSLRYAKLGNLILYLIPISALIVFPAYFVFMLLNYKISVAPRPSWDFSGIFYSINTVGGVSSLIGFLPRTIMFMAISILPAVWIKKRYGDLDALGFLKRSIVAGIFVSLVFGLVGAAAISPPYLEVKQHRERLQKIKSDARFLREPKYIPPYLINKEEFINEANVSWAYEFDASEKDPYNKGHFKDHFNISQTLLDKSDKRLKDYQETVTQWMRVTPASINGYPAYLLEHHGLTETVWETNAVFFWVQNQRPDILSNKELIRILESMEILDKPE